LSKGIPDKFFMERTGHRDVRSLQKYQRPSIDYKVEMSKAFDQIDTVHEPLPLKCANVEECKEVRKPMTEDNEDQSVSEKSVIRRVLKSVLLSTIVIFLLLRTLILKSLKEK
jgi:hypothetical protein